jgi:hypothetical protein
MKEVALAAMLMATGFWMTPGEREAAEATRQPINQPEPAAKAVSVAPRVAQAKPGALIVKGQAAYHATGRDGPFAAAGPNLRAALGSGWRGTSVVVSAAGRSIRVTLNDWCWCPSKNRVIDLSDEAFKSLAPLSVGVLQVTVSR